MEGSNGGKQWREAVEGRKWGARNRSSTLNSSKFKEFQQFIETIGQLPKAKPGKVVGLCSTGLPL
jgi:hypothetical protein